MKNTHLLIIIVLILAIVLFFVVKSPRSEAPTIDNGTSVKVEDSKTGDKMGDMKGAPVPPDYNAPVPPSSTPVKEFTVTGKNFSFSPSTITVKKGDQVKITFKNTGGFHDFKIDEFKVATHQIQTDQEETVTFVADKAGSFEYYCSVGTHRQMGMWGTLVVQ